MTNIKFLLLGTSLSFIPLTVNAQCVATQDCATLGYTETSCNGGKGVKCPFGNKWACLEECSDCAKLGFTYECKGTGEKSIGQSCNGKYQGCSCDSSYQYSCSGTGYAGGAGSACGGKYTQCSCASGYEWKNGSCQKKVLNGAQGDLYYCNGTVVAVKAPGMNFYVAMKDLGKMSWNGAGVSCSIYSFCDNVKGVLPSRDSLVIIYKNRSSINNLLSTNSGTKITDNQYWSSTPNYSCYYMVNMRDGDTYCYKDNYDYYVRCILTSW